MLVFKEIVDDMALFQNKGGRQDSGVIKMTPEQVEKEFKRTLAEKNGLDPRSKEYTVTFVSFSNFQAAHLAFTRKKDPDPVPQASAVPVKVRQERPAQVAASPFTQAATNHEGKKQDYQFAGIVSGSLRTYLFVKGGDEGTVPQRCIASDQPSDFEDLLPECPPEGIGAVRAAAKAARMVRDLREKGKNPFDSGRLKKMLVFQGVDDEGKKPKAVLAVYNGITGEKSESSQYRKTLPELMCATTDRDGYGEHQAAIAALEALEGKNAPAPAARAAVSESQSQFSRSAGAEKVSEKPTVQYLHVVTEIKGAPHAEGVFYPAGERPSRAEKTCLTARQIAEKMAGLAENHPDRAVYETALAAVQGRDQEIQSAPVTVMPAYHRR